MVLIGLMSGCGALENEGSPGANQPPEVFLVNVPPDGYISASSLVVQWYGTDVDGRIVRFDYTVVRATELDSVAATLPNPGGKEPVEVFIDNILDDDFPYWISVFADSVSKPTEDVVKLFASTEIADCDSVEVQGQNYPINCISRVEPQYFFIRAIDDVDSTSTIKYRTFQRTN
ncbi:MAG TPA: hypothetical protein VLA12_00910, partial [Planctomycetaceae bacterium]|nr:hypothetical protein [Planctomycetaceae bacterium]